MARDSRSALMALNRFGFGARGGASGDLVNAASDPRGFVKAELNRPNAVRLELPGLQTTPALAEAVFAYQAETKLAREAAAKSGGDASEAMQKAPDARMQMPAAESPDKRANAPRPPADAIQFAVPKSPAQPLNVIQKTYRAEALARLQRAMMADCGFVEQIGRASCRERV